MEEINQILRVADIPSGERDAVVNEKNDLLRELETIMDRTSLREPQSSLLSGSH